ncbi:MAG: Ig-like domain-containing protein [bacterium]
MMRITFQSPGLTAVCNRLAGTGTATQISQRSRRNNRRMATRPIFRLEPLEGRTMLDNGMSALALSNSLNVAIMQAPPRASTIFMGALSDTGTKGDGKTTYDAPWFRGVAQPGQRVNVSIDGVLARRVLSNARTGEWFIKSPQLASGVHDVTAVVENRAGLRSAPTNFAVTINGQRTVMLDGSNGQSVELKASHILGGGSQGFIVTNVRGGTLQKWSATRNAWFRIPSRALGTDPATLQNAPAIRTISYTDLVRWTPSTTARGIGQAFDVIPIDKAGGATQPAPATGTVPGKVVDTRFDPLQGVGTILTWNTPTDGDDGNSTRYSVELTRQDGRTLLYSVPFRVHELLSVEGGLITAASIWGATNTGAGDAATYNPVPVNLPPSVAPIEIKTLVDGQIIGTIGAVDPEGDTMTYVLTEIPKNGSVQLSPDGNYVYTPGDDYSGYDSFWVAVNDGGFSGFDTLGNLRPVETIVTVGDPSVLDVNTGALITRSLTIYNLTGRDLTLTEFTADRKVENVAPTGTVLHPAESTSIKLAQYAFVNNYSTATFKALGSGGGKREFYTYFKLNPLWTDWGCTSNVGLCEEEGSTTNGTAVLMLEDKPGTIITIPSGEGQQQADVLNQLCLSSWATCHFTPKSFDETGFTDWKLAANPIYNYTTSVMSTTLTVSTKQSTETGLSLKTKVEAEIFDIVTVGVETETSEKWTNEYEFSQDYNVSAQPGEKVTIEARDPVKRVIGEMHVVLENTVWILQDVYFDSPDPDRRSEIRGISTPII